jgi:hypothetical protein
MRLLAEHFQESFLDDIFRGCMVFQDIEDGRVQKFLKFPVHLFLNRMIQMMKIGAREQQQIIGHA